MIKYKKRWNIVKLTQNINKAAILEWVMKYMAYSHITAPVKSYVFF